MPTCDGKKFELKLDTASKVLKAMVEGFFQPADANGFVQEYTLNLKNINTSEYELHFDCKNLKVTSTDMVPMLTACFEMYHKDKFKKVIFDCGINSTLRLQLRRLGNNVGLQNFEIV